jgi:FkbM family methyltransferase
MKYKSLKILARQNWLKRIIREKIVRLFVNPDLCPNYNFEENIYGVKYKGNIRTYLDWNIFFFGAYEKQELELLYSIAQQRTNPVFIDIGANTGEYSIVLSLLCKQVVSFEPFDKIREKLISEIELNKLKNVDVQPVALGCKNEELKFFAPSETSCNAGTGSLLAQHEAETNKPYGVVQVRNASEHLENLKLPSIDIIKIDVEGFEKSVLEGLQFVMKKYKPVIMMEFSVTSRSEFGTQSGFEALTEGYTPYRIRTDESALFFFNSRKAKLVPFNFDVCPCNILLIPININNWVKSFTARRVNQLTPKNSLIFLTANID